MFALKQEPATAGFWGWFEDNQARLAKVAANLDDMKMDDLEPVLGELSAVLHDIDDRLFAELDADKAGKPKLVVSGDGELDAMLCARDLVANAPRIGDWKLEALRDRREAQEAIALPGGGEADLREAVFVMEVNDGKAEIAVGLEQWDGSDADAYTIAVEHYIEEVLGEADYSAGVAGVMALPIAELADEADPWPITALVNQFDQQLGD